MSGLFEKICNHDTLLEAWHRVLGKNAAGGLDGVKPKEIKDDINEIIKNLIDELKSHRYAPVPYAKKSIPKFNESNEWRDLSMPAVKDKIVQQAFVNVIGPLFEREFLDCSYAYRKDKGPVRAIKRVEHIIKSNQINWVATMDIDNFFDTLNHNILIEQLKKKIDEDELTNLVWLWLHAGIISKKGEYDEPDEGIAQGAVISPLLSNIYLHPFDKFAVENHYHYVRYSDNFIVLSKNKDELYVWYEKLKAFLEENLKLRLNEDPYPFKHINAGFVFLGIYFKGQERQISNGKQTKIFRKINWATEKSYQKDPEEFLKNINEMVNGVRRFYSFINPEQQFEAFNQHLIKRLRFLLEDFLKKGLLSSEKDLQAFLSRIIFFNDLPASSKETFLGSLTKEIYNTFKNREKESDSKQSTEKSARNIRVTAQKNRYLRAIGSHSEILVTTPGVFIGKTGGRVVLRLQRQNILEIPFSKIRNISINTEGVTLSSDVISQCTQSKIPITFYNQKGLPYAILQSPIHSIGDVSVLQIKTYETEKAMNLVKKIVTAKSKNQMNLIKFYLRHRKNTNPVFVEKALTNLKEMSAHIKTLNKIPFSKTYSIVRDQIFLKEAHISGLYWECMKILVAPELGFTKRERYQARDIVNMMLNYGYGILYQRVWQAVVKAGLNPYISFLHAFQNDKPTLIYDLVEEFRQPFVDKAIFSILTKGKKGLDLKINNEGMLSKETRDRVTVSVLKRLSSLIKFRGKKIKAEEVIYAQINALVLYLKGKENYMPFIAGY